MPSSSMSLTLSLTLNRRAARSLPCMAARLAMSVLREAHVLTFKSAMNPVPPSLMMTRMNQLRPLVASVLLCETDLHRRKRSSSSQSYHALTFAILHLYAMPAVVEKAREKSRKPADGEGLMSTARLDTDSIRLPALFHRLRGAMVSRSAVHTYLENWKKNIGRCPAGRDGLRSVGRPG